MPVGNLKECTPKTGEPTPAFPCTLEVCFETNLKPELVQVEYPQTYKMWLLSSQNRGLIFLLRIFSTVPLTNTDNILEVLMCFQTSMTTFVAVLLEARPEKPSTSI